MIRKKFFAYLMLGIIAFQLLPVKEVGRIFYGNQMVEEVCETSDSDSKNQENTEDLKPGDLYFSRIQIKLDLVESSLLVSSDFAKFYASRLADDTPTRPPLI
jgi:hypothetical protein